MQLNSTERCRACDQLYSDCICHYPHKHHATDPSTNLTTIGEQVFVHTDVEMRG